MTRRSGLMGAIWMAALLAAPAFAQDDRYYNYKIFHDPLGWYLDARGGHTSTGLSINSVETATRNAFDAWESVSCSYVNFTYLGQRNNGGNPDPQDAFSVSTNWVTAANDPYYELALGGGESVAAAIPLTYAGAVLQCDIYTNAVNFAWSVAATTPAASIDLQTAITREVGHCLGLADVPEPTSVMHWTLTPGQQRRTLTAADQDQLCDRYPQDGYGSPCVFDGGRGSCNQPGRTLRCITAPLPSGSQSTPFCSEGCNYSETINACEPPHVCRSDSTLFSGFSGACKPNNNDVVQVGAPCDGGTVGGCGPQPKAQCFLQDSLPSGSPAWNGGYCTQACTVGNAASCPSGASCVDLGGSVGPKCLQDCRAGSGDCRSGYSCVALSGYEKGVCVSSCGADDDCPNASGGVAWCRSCDGLCFEKDNPGKEIGEYCLNDTQCGPAQFCFKLAGRSDGVCTQTCTTACSACPNGSFCSDDNPSNIAICMRDCREYTCPAQTQCSAVAEGRACQPLCNTDLDCPDPYLCGGDGHCQHPGIRADAGAAGVLLFQGEGGAGSPNPTYDGGQGGGTGSGCGCGAAPGVTALWGGALALLMLQGRRRRWRHR